MARDVNITTEDLVRIDGKALPTSGSARTEHIYAEELNRVHISTDRNFAGLLLSEWVAGIVAALIISPLTWSGVNSSVHIHVLAAVFYGAILTSVPLYLIKSQPGAVLTRHSVAICQMAFSDLFIQLSAGRIETHFHVFGSLALLAFYRDWKVLVTASLVVALMHGFRGLYWPESVYGVVSPEPWRWLEHFFWIGFEDVWLIISTRNVLKEMRRRAEQQTEVEKAKASVEGEVVIRTAQLKASEQAFRQLAETAPVGIFQTDANGENLFINSELPRLLDCKRADLLAGQITSILAEESDSDILEPWTVALKSEEEFSLEHPIIGRSGRRVHLRAHAVPVSYESGEFSGYIGIVEDITDFKLTEQKLVLENELSNAFGANSNFDQIMPTVLKKICDIGSWDVAIFRWHKNDSVHGSAEPTSSGTVFWRSEETDPEQVMKLIANPAPLLQLDGQLRRIGNFSGFLAIPIISRFENLGVLELASQKISVLDRNSVSLLQSLGRDLGEVITRHIAEKTVRAREAMLRAIHDSVAEAIIALDQKATVISANPAAENIFGGDRSLLTSRTLWDLVPSYGHQNFDLGLWQKLCTALVGGELQRWEGMGRRLSGELFPIEVVLSEAGEGSKNILVAVVRDISERKESERRVSEFYSIVSHELRTPLTSIRGSLGLISGGLTGEIPPEAMELLGIASESCDRLIRLINDILDLKKLESGKFVFRLEALRPEDIVALSLKQIEGAALGKKVQLQSTIACNLGFLGDSDRIIQVLTNLLSNAIKFSMQEGVVRVEVTLPAGAQSIRFSVIDQGPGIAPEHISKLFGKFQQIDSSDTRPQEGTGLGLAISKSIVEQLHGQIGVESIPGNGSTFWFELPLCNDDSEG